jgi:hypothetical protein
MTEILMEPERALDEDAIEFEHALTNDEKLGEAWAAVGRLQDATWDGQAHTSRMVAVENSRAAESAPPEDKVLLVVEGEDPESKEVRQMPIRVLRGAHKQLADKTGIPWKYYERMLGGEPELAATNLTTWFRSEPSVRLLRMLRPMNAADGVKVREYGTPLALRAFLGASYRCINHSAVLEQVIPAAARHGATMREWHLGPERFDFRMTQPERTAVEVAEAVRERFPDINPHQMGYLEPLSNGVAFRNSETGHGAAVIYHLMEWLRCLNLMTSVEERVIHIGGRRSEEDGRWLKADTKRLDDAATLLRFRDKTEELLDPANVALWGQRVIEAAGEEVPVNVPAFEFIEGVGGKFDLTETEIEVLKEEFTAEATLTGNRNRLTVAQAMTATAKRLAEGNGAAPMPFARKADLEGFGFRILSEPLEGLLG